MKLESMGGAWVVEPARVEEHVYVEKEFMGARRQTLTQVADKTRSGMVNTW